MGLIDNVNVNVGGNGNIIDTLSTYVTKVLKPNIIDGKNVLTQDMMSTANTKYVIKYDYTLGENITVPAGCVLKFEGGSIRGEHTITGNNTGIEAELVTIFGSDTTFAGSWNVTDIYDTWFDTSVSDNTQVYKNILCLINEGFQNNVYIEKVLNIVPGAVYLVKSNTKFMVSGTVKAIPSTLRSYQLVLIHGVHNVEICGGGSIIGDKDNPRTVDGQWGHCIMIQNSEDISVHDLYLSKAFGDGVSIAQWEGHSDARNTNIVCYNLIIQDCWRQGISIVNGDNVIVTNCTLKDIDAHSPSCGIDIEAEPGMSCTNINISNCYFKNTRGFIYAHYNGNSGASADNAIVRNIIIGNCKFESNLPTSSIGFVIAGDNVKFHNITVDYKGNYKADNYLFYVKNTRSTSLSIEDSLFNLDDAYLFFYSNVVDSRRIRINNCGINKSRGIYSKTEDLLYIGNSTIDCPLFFYSPNANPSNSIVVENSTVDTSLISNDVLDFLNSKSSEGSRTHYINACAELTINNVTFKESPSPLSRSEHSTRLFEMDRIRAAHLRNIIENNQSYAHIMYFGEHLVNSKQNRIDALVDIRSEEVGYFFGFGANSDAESSVRIIKNNSVCSNTKAVSYPNSIKDLVTINMLPKIQYSSTSLPDSKYSFHGNNIMLSDGKQAWYDGVKWIYADGTPVA